MPEFVPPSKWRCNVELGANVCCTAAGGGRSVLGLRADASQGVKPNYTMQPTHSLLHASSTVHVSYTLQSMHCTGKAQGDQLTHLSGRETFPC